MYQCNNCSFKSENIMRYNRHQYVHRNELRTKFLCVFKNCKMQFKKYVNFKVHIFRNHNNKKTEFQKNDIYRCIVATCRFSSEDWEIFLSHLYSHLKIGDKIFCPFENCRYNKPFISLKNFHLHKFRHHRKINRDDTNIIDHSTLLDSDLQLNNSHLSLETQNAQNIADRSIQQLATTYLMLKSKYFITEDALKIIIDGINDTLDTNENSGATNYYNIMKKAHNNSNGVLRNTYAREKYFKNNFHLITPVKINLGRNNNHRLCHFYYIPILDIIKNLLLISDVKFYFDNSHFNYKNELLCDISCGTLYKQFMPQYTSSLRIILYQDAFENCNPLGSAKAKNKLIAVYMSLGNLPAYCRTKIDQLQLVLLCPEKNVKEFGFTKVFESLLRDLKILVTNGIIIDNKQIFGSLYLMLGDNLGSHQIGGFVENFSTSDYFCRFCYVSRNDLQAGNLFPKDRRSYKTYIQDLSYLESSNNDVYRGVKMDSCLNSLNFYHVTNPGLPPCLAHDLYEGIIPKDLQRIIDYLVLKNWFTYNYLNVKIQKICFFGKQYLNLPAIKKGKRIIGSASEIMKLVLILPLAVSDKIKNHHDLTWNMFLTLREICFILNAPRLSINQTCYLKVLLEEYVEYRKKLFPEFKFTPKHHYILHYPQLIRLYGPLKHLWTLRFESKHRYFKTLVHHLNNYKNLTKSLTERHQYLQALHFSEGKLFQDTICADFVDKCLLNEYYLQCEELLKQCPVKFVFIADLIHYRGITYKHGMHICASKDTFDNLELIRITKILINETYSDLGFIGNKIKVIYNYCTGLFEGVSDYSKNLSFIHYQNMLMYEPVFECKNNTFILKHAYLDY